MGDEQDSEVAAKPLDRVHHRLFLSVIKGAGGFNQKPVRWPACRVRGRCRCRHGSGARWAGEKVTITIPKSAGISAPADLTKAVVATQADKEKCTHNIVPVDTENHGVTLETASNDLNTADTMTVTRRCNYAGRIPDKDMSIAAKSTIRRVFASALGRSTSNVLASTAKLSQVGPFQYDASESGPHLLGKPLNVYGATSLIATTSLSHDELKPGVTLSTPLDTITRTDWEREKTFAGVSVGT